MKAPRRVPHRKVRRSKGMSGWEQYTGHLNPHKLFLSPSRASPMTSTTTGACMKKLEQQQQVNHPLLVTIAREVALRTDSRRHALIDSDN